MTGHAPHILVADPRPEGGSALEAVAAALGCALETVGTGEEALDAARRRPPAVVLLAADLADPSAYEVLRQLRDGSGAPLPIAFLSAARHQVRDEVAALLLGADDYLVKPLATDCCTARLHRLLRRAGSAAEGGRLDSAVTDRLTRREREVLGLLAVGNRPAEIAELLCITRKTTASHVEHILAKLGAHTQAQAVAYALRGDLPGNGRPAL